VWKAGRKGLGGGGEAVKSGDLGGQIFECLLPIRLSQLSICGKEAVLYLDSEKFCFVFIHLGTSETKKRIKINTWNNRGLNSHS
jgi:hypothetical protein